MVKRFSIVIALISMLGLLLVGCGNKENAPKTAGPVKFKLAHCTWVGYAPLYIAKEKGFFEKYNIAPELVIIEDESQYAGAMASGQIQALGNVLDREIIHYAKGTPERVVFAMDESAGGDGIVAKKEITKVEDLKGTTVGMDKSSTAYFFFLSVLDKYSLKEEDVTIQEMGGGDAGAAFVAGKIDAAVTWEPWLTNAGERDGGHVLVSSKDFPKTIVDVVVMREDFVKEHPEAVEGLTKAWFDAIDYYREHIDEGNAIMATALGLSAEEVADMAHGVQFFGRDENRAFFDDSAEDSIGAVAERAAGFWSGKGIIDKDFDLAAFIDREFVTAAAK